MFDTEFLLDSWRQACPQIHTVVSEASLPNLPELASSLSPSSVKKFPMRKYLIVDPTGWREAFDEWMAKDSAFSTMSAANPVRVWQNLAFAQWNREVHPQELADSFPRLLRYPARTRRLAAAALWSLEKKLGRPVVADTILFSSETPSPVSFSNNLGHGRLVSDGFLGAHLRVAADAVKAGWPGY